MSEQPDEQPEQQIEEVQPIEPTPKKRTRGPGRNPNKKKDDPNYFKTYYQEKTRPKLLKYEMIVTCPYCKQLSYQHNLTRHQQSIKCKLIKTHLEQENTSDNQVV